MIYNVALERQQATCSLDYETKIAVCCCMCDHLFCRRYLNLRQGVWFISLSPFYRLHCVCTNVCNGTMRNVSVRSTDCCEGFASAPSSNEFSFWYRHHYHRLRRLQTEGCPMRTYIAHRMPSTHSCIIGDFACTTSRPGFLWR